MNKIHVHTRLYMYIRIHFFVSVHDVLFSERVRRIFSEPWHSNTVFFMKCHRSQTVDLKRKPNKVHPWIFRYTMCKQYLSRKTSFPFEVWNLNSLEYLFTYLQTGGCLSVRNDVIQAFFVWLWFFFCPGKNRLSNFMLVVVKSLAYSQMSRALLKCDVPPETRCWGCPFVNNCFLSFSTSVTKSMMCCFLTSNLKAQGSVLQRGWQLSSFNWKVSLLHFFFKRN